MRRGESLFPYKEWDISDDGYGSCPRGTQEEDGEQVRKVFIGPPDLEARRDMLRPYMSDRPQEKMDWLDLAEQCEFYTSAEIENLVNEAAAT